MRLGPETKKLQRNINDWLTEILEGYKPRHIRDRKVIRDAVFGFNIFHKHEINILDNPLLQRLRYIHQTALALHTYPTATHTRFEHSLGCVVVADRMMHALNKKQATLPFDDIKMVEVRLAALLHDCGHGPFSHASEFVYDTLSSELQNVRFEDWKTFGQAQGHEILSYFIVTSPRFHKLWEDICEQYDPSKEPLPCQLGQVNFKRVGAIILGLPAKGYPKYVSEIINGPFDADKFDYIIRDGYFSGLVTTIDIDRLAVSLDLGTVSGTKPVLCIDLGGATILEQLLFNKMILFSSMYHHHKVRASFRQLVRLFVTARDKRIKLGDEKLDNAVSFLRLDDYTAFSHALGHTKLKSLADDIRYRRLLKRALVIDRNTLCTPASREKWIEYQANLDKISQLEKEIASKAGIEKEDVCIDFPPEPRIYKTALHSMVRVAPGRPLVPLDKLYPVGGWMAGYEQYRFRSYIFAPAHLQKEVALAAVKVLRSHGIRLDDDLSKRLAKWVT